MAINEMYNHIIQLGCLFLIFRQTSQLKVGCNYFLVFSITSIVGIFFIKSWFYIFYILFLFYIGNSNGLKDKKRLSFFYSVYSVSFYSLIDNLLFLLSDKFQMNNRIMLSLVPLIAVLINYGIFQTFKPNFKFLKDNYKDVKKGFLLALNTLLFVFCMVQYLSFYLEKYSPSIGIFRHYLSISFLVLIFIVILYLSMKIRLLQQIQLKELYCEQIYNLTEYTSQVESLYNEIRNIRHDYINIMSSLRYEIEAGNIEKISEIYASVLSKLADSLNGNKYDLAKLSNIKVTAIKGTLASKIIDAQSKGIAINVEILEKIEKTSIDLLDYVRILTIFMDNAIEASGKTDSPEVEVSFYVDKEACEEILIVKNNTLDINIDKRKIFERGFSTKGNNRGNGLSIVKDIVEKYQNVVLTTQFENQKLTQIVVIRED